MQIFCQDEEETTLRGHSRLRFLQLDTKMPSANICAKAVECDQENKLTNLDRQKDSQHKLSFT